VFDPLRELEAEVSLQKLMGMRRLPDSTTVGDWLRRMGRDGRGLARHAAARAEVVPLGGLAGLEGVNDYLAKRIVEKQRIGDYVLDVDAIVIESEKRAAQWTYKKVKGYQPMLGFLRGRSRLAAKGGVLPVEGPGLIVADEFREGNVPAGAEAVAFLERCAQQAQEMVPTKHVDTFVSKLIAMALLPIHPTALTAHVWSVGAYDRPRSCNTPGSTFSRAIFMTAIMHCTSPLTANER